jgi:antitoxin PrlF
MSDHPAQSHSSGLGCKCRGKVAFDFLGDSVIVSRVTNESHEDPAISSFLALLEKDIQTGQNVTTLPDDLARSMLATVSKAVDLDEEIVGNVAL